MKDQIQFTNDPAQYSKHHTRQKTEMDLENVDVAYNRNYIVALQVDNEGVVWAGTWGGGRKFLDRQFRRCSPHCQASVSPGRHLSASWL